MRFGLVALLILGAYLYLAVYPRFRPAARPQPIRFSHAAHFQEAECDACHLYAKEYYPGGTPTLAECQDCHEGTQSKSPEGKREEAKLQKYLAAGREIPWGLFPPLPSHVFFSHRRHTVGPKIPCASCHGNIAKTAALPAKPNARFTMSWCIHCHQSRKASTDCIACHR